MKTQRLRGLKMLRALVHDLDRLAKRHADVVARTPDFSNKEALAERDFVRMFGTKVRKVRYSNRADFVGLLVVGDNVGFLIVKDKAGERKARLVNIRTDNSMVLTKRYLPLRNNDSLSNLQRGLLNYVQ
jgi:hypothetical protein